MKRRLWLLTCLIVAGAALSQGCGSSSVCVPGAQAACTCFDGSPGAQACDASGQAFGECSCASGGAGGGGSGGAAGAGGGGGSGGGGGGSGGGGGGGGGQVCQPGEQEACYSGPADTLGVGPCHAGVRTCDPSGTWAPCVGEMLPEVEDCATPVDDACDGQIAPCGGGVLWAQRFGDAAEQLGPAMVLDDAGDVIVAGLYSGAIDLGGQPLTNGVQDIFVAKLDGDTGAHAFSFAIQAAAATFPLPAVDGLGNVFVGAGVAGFVDFGGALPGGDQIVDAFVGKASADGAPVWGRRWKSGNNGFTAVDGLHVTKLGEVVVTGTFQQSIDVGCGPISPPAPYVNGSFLAKLDGDGNCLWSRARGGDLTTGALATAPNGDVFVGGRFSGLADFGGGPTGGSVNSPSFVFLERSLPDGTFQVEKHWLTGQPGAASVGGMAIDAAGAVYLTGVFGPAGGNPPPAFVDFGLGPLMTNQPSGSYVLKLDATLSPVWNRSLGPGYVAARSLALGPTGDVIVAGTFGTSLDLGGGVSTALPGGCFVARLDNDDVPLDLTAIAGCSVSAEVAVDGQDGLYLAADFQGTTTVNGATLTSAGAEDIFVASLGP
jgi:hypothetical protein